eukprot:gene34987-43143_t
MADRGVGLIVSILGILKAGSAYIPIDPTFPANRQSHMMSHSQTQLLIVDEANFETLKTMGVEIPTHIIVIETKTGAIVSQPCIEQID